MKRNQIKKAIKKSELILMIRKRVRKHRRIRSKNDVLLLHYYAFFFEMFIMHTLAMLYQHYPLSLSYTLRGQKKGVIKEVTEILYVALRYIVG